MLWRTCSTDHKNVPNIVSLSHCLEQLNSCIFNSVNSYLKRRRVYWCVRDDLQLCIVCVHSLITHLQMKKISVMYKSAHDAITFHLLEIISITTHNQKQFRIFHNIRTRYIFQRVFYGKYWRFYGALLWKKSIWTLRVNGIVLVTGTRVNVNQIS